MSRPPALTGLAKPVNPPVERASTLLLNDAEDLLREGRTYGRAGGPTRDALAEAVAAMEGADEPSALTPSGLAAVTTAVLASVTSGDHVLVTDGCYAPTRRFCDETLPRFGVSTTYTPPGDIDALRRAIQPNTRAVLVEQPASLTFEVEDLPGIAETAKRNDAALIVDHSWGGGAAFSPLAHGADLAALSLTKYPSGGSDIFLGAVSGRGERLAKAKEIARTLGSAVSPDDAYLALRGLRSLPTRLAQHAQTALALADWLAGQPHIARVLHPAHPSHPAHAVFQRDFLSGSGVFAVVLRAENERHALAFFRALEVFALGYSYGGHESLAILCDPQLSGRHHPIPYGGPVARLAVGLEPLDTLQADLARGLAALDGR